MSGPADPLMELRQISHLAYGFMASKALFAALDLGVFTALADGPKTQQHLESSTGVAGHRLATFLTVLVALGLLVRDNDSFANAPAAARYLVRGRPGYFGEYYRLQIDKQVYPFWEQLGEALAGRATTSFYSLIQDPHEAKVFSHGQHQGSMGPAILLSRLVDLTGCSQLLDVGGGTGAFSIALCRRHPSLRSTILDFASVIQVAHAYVNEAGLADRIGLLAGNALDMEWPTGQDVILMSYLLSAVGASAVEPLLECARRSLEPGGVLILHDFMLDSDRCGPRNAALWLLGSVIEANDSISFSAEDLIEKADRQGFIAMETHELIPEITKVVIARLPTG